MKNQYFVQFGISGEPSNQLYQFNVDLELQKNADTTTYLIMFEVANKFNAVYRKSNITSSGKQTQPQLQWTDISITILTKLN